MNKDIYNGIPLINGVMYDWGCVVVTIGGVPVTGITAISYKDNQAVENVYGAGRHPIGRAFGKIEPEASITLHQEEVEALQSQSPTGRLQDLGLFDVVVTYAKGALIHTDKIRNCSFKENPRDWKQGDTQQEVQLPLLPSHIEWGR